MNQTKEICPRTILDFCENANLEAEGTWLYFNAEASWQSVYAPSLSWRRGGIKMTNLHVQCTLEVK